MCNMEELQFEARVGFSTRVTKVQGQSPLDVEMVSVGPAPPLG